MNYEVLNLFPVLVMRFPNFLDDAKCDILDNKYRNSEIMKQHHYFTNDALCSHTPDLNLVAEISESMEDFKDFNKRIDDTLLEYSKITGFRPTCVSNSWFNIQRRGSALFDHMHPLSFVSGCLYLSFPEGSNNIFFWNPSSTPAYIPRTEETIYSSETYWVKPAKGELVLFPGWIKHGSNGYENNSDNRSSIAFNSSVY